MALSFSVASFCVKKLLLKSLVKAILFIGRINILLDSISIVKSYSYNIEMFSAENRIGFVPKSVKHVVQCSCRRPRLQGLGRP